MHTGQHSHVEFTSWQDGKVMLWTEPRYALIPKSKYHIQPEYSRILDIFITCLLLIWTTIQLTIIYNPCVRESWNESLNIIILYINVKPLYEKHVNIPSCQQKNKAKENLPITESVDFRKEWNMGKPTSLDCQHQTRQIIPS